MKCLASTLVVALLAACNGNPLFEPNPDGGSKDMAACSAATDEASCKAIPGCEPQECAICNGAMAFVDCVPAGSAAGVFCPALCEQPTCAMLQQADCDARPDCYSTFSGDLPCNNESCSNHFVKCVDGPFVCPSPTGVCTIACTTLTPSCPSGYGPNQACCPSGCVEAALCASSSACTSDQQCGAQAYCQGLVSVCSTDCQLTIGTAATGTCHRSCVGQNAPCSCVDDADCPGLFTSCDLATGQCKTIAPPICHAQCPAGCADESNTQYGEICVCSSC